MKLFKVTDLFEIRNGLQLLKSEGWGDPIYPYVSSSSINNGISGMCDRYNYENIISVNCDGSSGYSFYHPYKVFINSSVRVLIPKFKLTENIALYLCIAMTKLFVDNYNFSHKLSIARLKLESIYLPEKNGDPDWEYIEDYMSLLKPKIKY